MGNSKLMCADVQVPNRIQTYILNVAKAGPCIAFNARMTTISSSLSAYQCLRAEINPYAEEVWILALNSQLTLIKKDMLFRGTADFCVIHPRDIFRTLLLCNACSFVMAHNHPSNQLLPSKADLKVTKKIFLLTQMLQIPLVDHLILAEGNYYSLADHGWLTKWKTKNNLVY